MAYFDVFNGDADGLCALQQIRLADPRESTLITGVKRDIALVRRVEAGAGDTVTVLDVSLDKNREAVDGLLAKGASVRYFDHHFPGEIPNHPGFSSHIETTADRGTSLLVDDYLEGRFRAWAVVGTFGDNFDASARRAAASLDLTADQLGRLRDLGIYLNYNGYGAVPSDLHFAPETLFARMRPYADPLEFIERDDTFDHLENGYRDDMAKAERVGAERETPGAALFVLPAEPWARRVSGVLANRLAQECPDRAQAMLTRRNDGGYVVSVRAPINRGEGADELCRRFPSGGGRKAAAGINQLPDDLFDDFARAFAEAFPGN